jgi:hypothetical protein
MLFEVLKLSKEVGMEVFKLLQSMFLDLDNKVLLGDCVPKLMSNRNSL